MNASFNQEDIRLFTDQSFIGVQDRLMRHAPTTIWVVTVGDQVYSRSFSRSPHSWFDALMNDAFAVLTVAGRQIPVKAIPEKDAQVNRAISEAYANKYNPREPEYVPLMVTDAAVAATVRWEPASS